MFDDKHPIDKKEVQLEAPLENNSDYEMKEDQLETPKKSYYENLSRINLTFLEKTRITEHILSNLPPGNLSLNGSLCAMMAIKFNLSTRTIKGIWSDYLHGKPLDPQNCLAGKASSLTPAVLDVIRDNNKRTKGETTVRQLSQEIKDHDMIHIPISTLHAYLYEGGFGDSIAHIKPKLTKQNETKRLLYILSNIFYSPLDQNFHFKPCARRIFIDEKIFCLTPRSSHKVRSHFSDEKLASPTITSKDFQPQIMYLFVFGFPEVVKYQDQDVWFDGKIGIFPFMRKVIIVDLYFD